MGLCAQVRENTFPAADSVASPGSTHLEGQADAYTDCAFRSPHNPGAHQATELRAPLGLQGCQATRGAKPRLIPGIPEVVRAEVSTVVLLSASFVGSGIRVGLVAAMSLCATISVRPCMARMKEVMSPMQCSSPTYSCMAKAVGGGVALPQQLSLATVALRKCGGSSLKSFGRPTRSLVVKGATTEDVEAEKELIEMDAMERMEKTLEATKSSFNTVRTGRANPSLLDRVQVEYYGINVILKSIAQISTPDGSTILITPFDKSSLTSIEKALVKSDVGITPNNDGSVIRLNVPQLTADRRKELMKLASKLSEDGKVAIRNVRREAIKSYEKLEKEKKLSEDNVKDLSDDIQKLTDDYIKKVDALCKQKEKELQSI